LLKFFAIHPGKVFTREQLLSRVWGYEYYGGARTVDVHVRRLRAKLGPEHEQLIGTVRNVGYKFVRPVRNMTSRERAEQERAAEQEAEAADSAESEWANPDRASPLGVESRSLPAQRS
ncbi:MAG: winged helix-turn-helix domain-containing protein, partial [Pseudonocardiaceae bacterium]